MAANDFENIFGKEQDNFLEGDEDSDAESDMSDAYVKPLWIPYLAYDEGALGNIQDYMQARKGAEPPLGTTSNDYYEGNHPEELYNNIVIYWGKTYLEGVLPPKIGEEQ